MQPRIRELSAIVGPDEGNHEVIIRGAHLDNATRVAFGGNEATIVAGTPDELRVITPGGRGTVYVTIESRYGTQTTLDDAYTYDPVIVLRRRRAVRP